MDGPFDYKEFAILYVDDEEKSLRYFTLALEPRFRIYTASNALEGLRILQEHQAHIGIVLTDQRMPGEQGVQLLEKARRLHPHILRILVTAYSDLEAAILAVNRGAIYKYLTKPWEAAELEATLQRGLELFISQRQRNQLLKEKLSLLHDLVVADRLASLGTLTSGLSHHLRNSLVAIRTFIDLAPGKLREERVDLDRLRNPAFWKDFYAQAQLQMSRITTMLSELEDASGISPIRLQSQIQLRSVVSAVLESLKDRIAEKQIRVENRVPESLPPLSVDAERFPRLIELLLMDEVISVPECGWISLQARASAREAGAESAIEIRIEDDGPPIPNTNSHSIFDPFFVRSEHPQQHGFNLMACYFLIHQHGGKIEVRSPEGKGARWDLTFPIDWRPRPVQEAKQDFLSKVLSNEALWEKLIAEF